MTPRTSSGSWLAPIAVESTMSANRIVTSLRASAAAVTGNMVAPSATDLRRAATMDLRTRGYHPAGTGRRWAVPNTGAGDQPDVEIERLRDEVAALRRSRRRL